MAGVGAIAQTSKSPAATGKAPAKAAGTPAQPRMAPDRVELSPPYVPFTSSAEQMRKGILETLGGAGLLVGGGVGLALTLSAPVIVPILCGVAALAGAGLMIKGVHDYGRGIADLVVDMIMLPVHIARAIAGE